MHNFYEVISINGSTTKRNIEQSIHSWHLSSCWIFVNVILPLFVTENRAGPSNLGNVISQILLCKQITPDFNQEEICSIAKDSQEMSKIIKEMQEYMPKQENNIGESELEQRRRRRKFAHLDKYRGLIMFWVRLSLEISIL